MALIPDDGECLYTGPVEEPAKLGQRTSGEIAEANGHGAEQSSRPPSVFSVSQVHVRVHSVIP